MRKITLFTVIAILTMAFIGCETTKETNSNNAIVVNDNANVANISNKTVANADKDDWDWDNDVKREDFDKDKEKYEKASKERYKDDSIGQGANDLWLWTKTRAAFATTDDLRESTINVDVANDVVTLKGTVGTKAQQDSAVKVAKGIEGVKDVKDMLKVEPKDSVTNMSTDSDGKTDADKSNSNK